MISKKAPVEREQTTIRLPKDVYEEMKKRADKQGMTFNSFLLSVFRKYLEEL
jgi:predicted DNA binding CopG/RHH family protein